MDRNDGRRRLQHNPFLVLGLPASATRAEIEREGAKLLGMLELGLSSAKTYATPMGRTPRTAHDVREAMAELRDPDKRLAHELWAEVTPLPSGDDTAVDSAGQDGDGGAAPSRARRWPDALEALGFGARR